MSIELHIPDVPNARAVLRALRREQRIVGCDVCRIHADVLEVAIVKAEEEAKEAFSRLPFVKVAGYISQGTGFPFDGQGEKQGDSH